VHKELSRLPTCAYRDAAVLVPLAFLVGAGITRVDVRSRVLRVAVADGIATQPYKAFLTRWPWAGQPGARKTAFRSAAQLAG
jgi:hypothetical protein